MFINCPLRGIAQVNISDDLSAPLSRLTELGAKKYEPRTERGDGFAKASIIDPFGNIVGLMHSPHYLQTLESGVK